MRGFCKGVGHYIRNKCGKKGEKKSNKMRKKGLGKNKLSEKLVGEFTRKVHSIYSRLRNEGKNLVKTTKNSTSFLIKTAGNEVKVISLELCKEGSGNLPPYINIIYAEGGGKPKEEVISVRDFSEEELYWRANAFFS